MAVEVARLEAVLRADTSHFDRGMDRSEKRGKKWVSVLKRGFLAAGAGAIAGGTYAVKAASDLEEQINKTTVVFRGSEKGILSWSKTTATGLGISRRAALEATGTFGNMLVPMGFARKEAGQMSTRMVELAADMASFNNASPEDTLDALRSGLAGETEPLRRFGIFLNDARLKAVAMNMGIYDGVGALDAQAKAQATYKILLKDTKDAQGDFQRTSGSMANQQRILRAQFEDVSAQLGTKLLPVVVKVMAVLLRFVNWASGVNGAEKISHAFATIKQTFVDIWTGITDFLFNMRTKFVTTMLAWALKVLGIADKAFGWLPGLGPKIDKAIDKINEIKRAAELASARRYAIRFVTNAGQVKSNIEDLRGSLPGRTGDVRYIDIASFADRPDVADALNPTLALARQFGVSVTSTYRPGATVRGSGSRSDHSYYPSKAVDFAGSARGMASFARAVAGLRGVDTVIYSPLGLWKAGFGWGNIVSSATKADHYSHVHVDTFDRGGWLRPGWTLAGNFTGRPERVGGATTNNFYAPNYLGREETLMDSFRRMVSDYERRNGRSPF